MLGKILNSESAPVSIQELFSPMTEMEKTQSGYISKNLFDNKKTKLLSSYISNKSLINPSSNFSSLKNTDALFSSVSPSETEFKNLLYFFTSIILLFLLFLLIVIPALQ
jgi:hypothetical protein